MESLSIIFIFMALVSISFFIVEWIETKNNKFKFIGGWACAIIYCFIELISK